MKKKKKNGTQKQQFSLWLCTILHLFGLYKLATKNESNEMGERVRQRKKERMKKKKEKKTATA